jgi:hypothetical protein
MADEKSKLVNMADNIAQMSRGEMIARLEKLEREKQEMAQCTFKPKINKSTLKGGRVTKDLKQ